MKLGFIGTGIITTSVVTGFCESGMENLQIVVSPRNKERAQMLHEKYPEIVSVAADNQEVVDRSDWVFSRTILLESGLPVSSDRAVRRKFRLFLKGLFLKALFEKCPYSTSC